MISGYHANVAEHYEKFPYPSYPWFASASWKQLQAVDCQTWGASHEIKDIWIAGCGTISPLMFGRRNFMSKILASDLSESALQICQRRLRIYGMRNVQLKCEDIFEANYSEKFDAIDSYGVIHHTVSPVRSLDKLVTALKPGGILRLMVYSQEAREQIENLRSEVKEKKLSEISDVKKFLAERVAQPSGDLKNSAGIADALLNPIVHTYTRKQFEDLLAAEARLRVLKIEDSKNFVAFCLKL
ncbi:MAG: methyltransferase domain-containing protein [Deltaproteobacteria bacterium]|nr:methyltransferase domain-containing protein [Deltaproteobacteria bacterium]